MEKPFEITWSPSIDKPSDHQTWRFSKFELFPPFMQKKLSEFVKDEELECLTEVPSKLDAFPKVTSTPDTPRVTVCRYDFFRPPSFQLEDAGEKPSVSCTDDCRKIELTCEDLRESLHEESIRAAEIADDQFFEVSEYHDDDDYESLDEFEDDDYESLDELDDDEEELEEEKKQREKFLFPWLHMCKDLDAVSDVEEDFPDTTDPYMSHELYLPYKQIPRARYFQKTSDDILSATERLNRRPRSPVRKVLPGRFNLKAAYIEWCRERRGMESTKIFEKSKKRVSRSLQQLPENQLQGTISSVVLRAIYEQVTLTLMDVKIDTDIHTFVNVAVIWALSELELFNRDMLSDEQLRRSGLTTGRLPEDFMYCNYTQKDILDITGDGGMRKTLLGVYRPPFSSNIHVTLHRRLPWPYVSPSHERGHMKFYPNVRERIDEIVAETSAPDATHIPDVMCFHLRDVSNKSYLAYRRTTKRISQAFSSQKLGENAFLHLASFV